MIDHETAERLREILGRIQLAVCSESDVPEQSQEKLVTLISTEGFRFVDELEGVVR